MIYKNGTIQNKDFRENESGSTYTVVGTLTNNDGVFSGFAASNYLKANCSVASNVSGLEIYGEYCPSNITAEQYVFCTSTRNLSFKVMSSKFVLQTSANNGSSWNVVGTGTTTLVVNTNYPFKVITDSTTVKAYIMINGSWVLQATNTLPSGGTYTSNPDLCFGLHVPSNAVPNAYPIDIKHFIVKKNGAVLWSGIDALLINSNAKIHKNYIASREFYEV